MPDRELADHDGNVTAWRLQQIEDQIRELTKALQGSVTSLGAQITALSNQIGSGLASLPDHYAPRREAEERHGAIDERFAALDKQLRDRAEANAGRWTAHDQRIEASVKRIERIEQAGWAFAIGMVIMLLGVVFAIVKAAAAG